VSLHFTNEPTVAGYRPPRVVVKIGYLARFVSRYDARIIERVGLTA
jgi:hypothetical protein